MRVKAQQVLPEELLAEIQKYVQGQVFYIPKATENKKAWGENTPTRSMLQVRNQSIVQAFKAGTSIIDLAATKNTHTPGGTT